MPGSADDQARERSAVRASFWLGGVGLAMLKGFAYYVTGSILVRTSMFESIGDVISSAIMELTARKVNDTRDASSYPVGKGRLTAVGVLFFCAFMCSSMSSMALDSLQAVLGEEEDASAGPNAALRRLFAEKPLLRLASGGNVDAIVAQYAVAAEAGDGEQDSIAHSLLIVCVVVKVLLWVYCRGIERKRPSEIVAALGDDHRNDSFSITIVIATLGLGVFASDRGWDNIFVTKAEPMMSLLLAVWIVYGWIQNSLEQVTKLSDSRADEEEIDVSAVRAAAEAALQSGWGSASGLQLQSADVYTAGEGFRVQLGFKPTGKPSQGVAEAFIAVEKAVREVSEDVRTVDLVMGGKPPAAKLF